MSLIRYWTSCQKVVPVDFGLRRCRWWSVKHRTDLVSHVTTETHDIRTVFCRRCGSSVIESRRLVEYTAFEESA
jgi:hypothetical protein